MTEHAHEYRVGDATVTCVRELLLDTFTPSELLADADPAELARALWSRSRRGRSMPPRSTRS